MGFVEILEAYDGQQHKDLDFVLDKFLEEKRTIPPMKATDTIRASGLSKMCPREEAICVKKNITRSDVIGAQLSRIFRMGRAYETAYRDDVLGDLQLVIGKWKCHECGYLPDVMDGVPRYHKPKKCGKCNSSKGFKYIEEFALDKPTNIGGSTDGFLYWNFDYAILEMKTANSRRFKMVQTSGPFPDHIDQATVYMRLHGFKKALIVYCNKDTSAELRFWVDYDPATAKMLFNKGVQMKDFFEDGVMPIRTCVNTECPRAKDCSVVEQCFGEFNLQ